MISHLKSLGTQITIWYTEQGFTVIQGNLCHPNLFTLNPVG